MIAGARLATMATRSAPDSGGHGDDVGLDLDSQNASIDVSMLQSCNSPSYNLSSAGVIEINNVVFVEAVGQDVEGNYHLENKTETAVGPADVNDVESIPEEYVSNTSAPDDVPEDVESHIGEYVLYYCKLCVYHSTVKQEVARHVSSGSCRQQDHKDLGISQDPDATLKAAALTAVDCEHSYASKIVSSTSGSQAQVIPQLSNFDSQPILLQNLQLSDGHGLPTASQTGLVSAGLDGAVYSVDDTSSGTERAMTSLLCPTCPYTDIHSYNDLVQHTKCHQASGYPHLFMCYLCQSEARKSRGRPLSITADWQKVRQHLSKVHDIDFALPCPSCDQVFKSHKDLDRHKFSHWKCPYLSCSYQTDHQEELRIHVKCHKGDRYCKFRCYVCHYEHPDLPKDWQVMHDHLVLEHKGTDSISARFKCQVCGQDFQHKPQFDQHYKQCTLPTVKCDHCGQLMNLQKTHECTVRNDHPATTEELGTSDSCCSVPFTSPSAATAEDQKRNFLCHRHNVHFETQQEFDNHILEAHSRSALKRKSYAEFMTGDVDEKIVPDQEMTPVTASSGIIGDTGLSSATRTQNSVLKPTEITERQGTLLKDAKGNEVPRVGDAANGAVKEFSVLKKKRGRKKLLVDPSKVTRCPVCYKKFADQSRLDMHTARSHTAEKLQKVRCGICPKFFRNQIQRRNHIRTVHEGIKRKPANKSDQIRNKIYYLCSACNYLTPDKTRLRNHELAVHHGIMPYSCEQCDYKTKEKSDMERHKLKHSGIKRHSCQFCSYQTNERWCLVNHCSKQHNVQLPRLNRDTMGCALSMRWQEKRRKIEQQQMREEQALLEQQLPALEYTHLLTTDDATYMVASDPTTQPILVEHLEDLRDTTELQNLDSQVVAAEVERGQVVQVAQEVDIVASDGTVEQAICGTVEQSIDGSAEQPNYRTVQVVFDTAEQQTTEQAVYSTVEEPTCGPVEESTHGPLEQSVHGTIQQTVYDSGEQIIYDGVEPPVHGTVEQSIHGMVEQSIHGLSNVNEIIVHSDNVTDQQIMFFETHETVT